MHAALTVSSDDNGATVVVVFEVIRKGALYVFVGDIPTRSDEFTMLLIEDFNVGLSVKRHVDICCRGKGRGLVGHAQLDHLIPDILVGDVGVPGRVFFV